jgi:hypothetical protein
VRRSALAALAIVAVLVLVLVALVVVRNLGGVSLSDYFFSITAATFTVLGAVIVWRQPGNSVGWVFAAVGLLWGTGDLATAYSHYGTAIADERLPLVTLAAWYGEWFWPLWLLLIFGVIPVLFPTGRPLNHRWRAALVFLLVYGAVVSGAAMFEDRLDIPGPGWLENPIGIEGFHDIETGFFSFLTFPLLLVAMAIGLAAIIVRFRRSRGEEREQLKWFAFAVGAIVVQFAAQIVADSIFGVDSSFMAAIFMSFVPTAAVIAILRYRLYDIDIVINRTLVYALLTAVLAAAYVGLVFMFQAVLAPVTAESDLAIVASTLAVAALFRPVRARVQGFIDRRFYRRKFDAQRTLEEFSANLRDEVELESLSSKLTAVVSDTMQPAHVSIWLRGEGARL